MDSCDKEGCKAAECGDNGKTIKMCAGADPQRLVWGRVYLLDFFVLSVPISIIDLIHLARQLYITWVEIMEKTGGSFRAPENRK